MLYDPAGRLLKVFDAWYGPPLSEKFNGGAPPLALIVMAPVLLPLHKTGVIFTPLILIGGVTTTKAPPVNPLVVVHP